MGFYDAIQEIISACPIQRQTLMFSATYPAEIKKLAGEFMLNPKKVVIEEFAQELDIEQRFYEVSNQSNKFPLLLSLLKHYKPTSALIFCNTKEQTTQLSQQLIKEGFSAIALNGDMEQVERDVAMIRFVNQSCSILVATDVAARGLDIKELPAVINYDLAFEHDVHIHRIGRTGRAGSKGLALSITTPSDAERLCLIEDGLKQPLTWGNATELNKTANTKLIPEMVTLCLCAGRKDKIRPGDILGALTKEAGLAGNKIGKIDIATFYSYVAVHRSDVDKAFHHFQNGKLKGRSVKVKKL
jgi:ATP-independent RNA helicase DbpA